MTSLCGCTRPLPSGWNLCKTCRNDLTKHLRGIPFIEQELETSLTHDHGIDYRTLGGSKSTDVPLPGNARVARTLQALQRTLATWATTITITGDETPSNKLRDLSAWLLKHTDRIAKHDQSWDAFTQITGRCQDARWLIYTTPADKEWIGRCEGQIQDDGDEITETHCDGHIWNDPARPEGWCDQCGREYDAATKRREALDKLEDHIMTAGQIATAAISIGHALHKATRERVRAIIPMWNKRGRIAVKGSACDLRSCEKVFDQYGIRCSNPDHQKDAYRFGDVRPLLYETYGDTA